jgi:secreted trypsin-like serine protease
MRVGGLSKNIKIIGGEDASVSEFLHSVNLRLYNKHHCGGSIIGKWYILTAAHCVSGTKKNKNNIRIYSRCFNVRSNSEAVFTIDRVNIHPSFTATKHKQSMLEYDIAVITVYQ